ncbi:M15 family metallopeptidase [Acinetobacter baumannii]
MSYNTIDSVFVKQYADTYVALLEQKESKLLSTVTNVGAVTGTSFTVNEMGTLGDEFITWGGDWKKFKDGPHFELIWSKYN